MADQQQGHYSFTATLQLALAAIFLCDAFTYSVIEPYLPAAFPAAESVALSMLFGTYSFAQLAVGLLLLLVQLMPQAAAMQPHHDAMVASAAFMGFAFATVPSVVFPGSLAAMFVQRWLLGTFAAGFCIHGYRGIARAFEPQVSLKAAVWINAGELAWQQVMIHSISHVSAFGQDLLCCWLSMNHQHIIHLESLFFSVAG